MSRTLDPFTQEVLNMVKKNPGITSREVAEFTRFDSAYVQKTLNSLLQRGYILNTRPEGGKAWRASGSVDRARAIPGPVKYETYVPEGVQPDHRVRWQHPATQTTPADTLNRMNWS